jgi:hypothetical protein
MEREKETKVNTARRIWIGGMERSCKQAEESLSQSSTCEVDPRERRSYGGKDPYARPISVQTDDVDNAVLVDAGPVAHRSP